MRHRSFCSLKYQLFANNSRLTLHTPTMSTSTNPANPQSSLFETAEVRVISRRPWPQSDFKSAYVLVSSRIYWMRANKDSTNKAQSFLDFRNADNIELSGQDDGTWDDVHKIVKVNNHNRRPCISVTGRLRGRTGRNNSVFLRDVQVEIVANTLEQHEVWLNQIRARVTPWNLLQQVVKDIVNRAPSSGAEELEEALGVLVTSCDDPHSTSTDNKKRKLSDFLGTVPEKMEKITILDKLTAQGAAAVGSSATLAARVEHVAETAKLIGDASKVVAGVSAIFNLVALGAQGVSLCAKAMHGRRVLPIALGRIGIILEYVLRSMTEILKPSQGVHEVDIDFVFDALRQTVDTMDLAETQLLRGRGSQIIHAEDVQEVEGKLGDLIHRVVTAGTISKISILSEILDQLKKERELWEGGPHHVRPSLSAFFSGRTMELATLRGMLEKHGSAVLTQYGGLGKTELMIALADRAERDGVVPGGVFWVTVDGGESDAISSLARLAEKLSRKKMGEEDRRNPNIVVEALKQGLNEREGRWLLCLDNADDSKVNGILSEVCRMVGGRSDNGWVVVTSRQGQPEIWSEMMSEQKLALKPLSTKDAMVLLWRRIRKLKTDVEDDDGVMNSIKKLQRDDAGEYRALKELCGDEGECSLGGLPLALAQAGAYIARFECSLVEYLKMFKNANSLEHMKHIMKNTEEVKPIRDSQRSIWTTWKISVGKLSENAYAVLRSMAILGPGGVREAIVKRILKRVAADDEGSVDWMFPSIVIEELVHGSSLISRDGGETRRGDWMYRMHRLVRRFIVSDMERGSAEWNGVYSVALVEIHEVVETELGKEGNSYAVLPDLIGSNHDEFVTHAHALVNHYTLPAQDAEKQQVAQVEDIHRYCGTALMFMGKAEEEMQVWEQLVNILQHEHASIQRRRCSEPSSDAENEENSRIASAYNQLGKALRGNGKFNDALSVHEKSLEMYLAIHGHDKPHPDIAASLSNLGGVHARMGKLEEALDKHEKSLEMKLAIHGHDKPHPDIATSLNNLGSVHARMGKLEEALDKHEKSLEMTLAIHGHDKPHPDIADSLSNLGSVHARMGKLEEALDKHEKSLEMKLAIHGHDKPHPDIAASLCNLGNVHERMGKLEEALDKHERSLEMYLAIHGHDKPHPDIAASLNNLGNVHARMGKLEEALDKHEKSLEMELAVHGHDKPHPDIAISLWSIGYVHHRRKSLNQAAELLERSLAMLRIVHAGNPEHPDIENIQYHLADVYEDQGRRDEAAELRQENERNTDTDKTSDGEAPSVSTGP